MVRAGILRRVRLDNERFPGKLGYFLSRVAAEYPVTQAGETRIVPKAVHSRIYINHEELRGVIRGGSFQFLESFIRAPERIVEERHQIPVHVFGVAKFLELFENRSSLLLATVPGKAPALLCPQPGHVRRHDRGEPVLRQGFLESARKFQCLRIV